MSYFAPSKGIVNAENSTTTLLTAGSVFTGTWVDVSSYSDLSVGVKTDQNGTYSVQFSPDGSNIDSTLTRYYRTTQIEPPHSFEITRKYARIVFTNTSASDQTYLRLQTMLGNRGQLNIPLDANMSQDYDSTSVRPTKFEYEVALGRRQGYTTWNKFGVNTDLDVGTEVIANFGGTFTPMTTARTLSIVSTSASDDGDPAGVGARSLVIYGVDANYVSQTVVITLNGTTPVVTAETWLGVNRVAIYLAGSSLGNVGTITITATTDNTTQARLDPGEGTTQQLIYFTSADNQALADYLLLSGEKISGGGSPRITFKGWVYSAVSNAKYLVFYHVMDTTIENHINLRVPQPFVIGEKSCLWFEATTDIANSTVSGRLSLIEVRDVDG